MRNFSAAFIAVASLCVGNLQAAEIRKGPDGSIISGQYRGTVPVARFDVSPRLSSIPAIPVYSGPMRPGEERIREESPSGLEWLTIPQSPDAIAQGWKGPSLIPSPKASFDGQPNISGVNPPDPVGDVGPNHYVAMSNSVLQIFEKDGTSLLGPININTLWAGFGGACQVENSGDPIVLYDQFADRWLITQFTSAGPEYFNCVAISQSGDPTGAYYRYAFSTGTSFPDYPKYGVWRDAYYISTREFGNSGSYGIGGYALNREQMIAGNPNPVVISFVILSPGTSAFNIGDGLLPADIDGMVMPPDGSPQYFMGTMDAGGPYSAPQDALTLWKFHADFDTPANSTFELASTIPVAEFDSIYPCSPGSRACLPQLGTSAKVDVQSYRQRMINRLAYRNFGDHESLVSNQSVEAAASVAGVRWWEIRNPGGTPIVHQEGTYAPGITDGVHRWMGSAAMDASGNIALGFSATSSTMYPSIWYTGRLASDPPGTMSLGEGVIVSGTGSNTSSNSRWGDYTSMNVDPTDDCTFWYVNQYTPVTSNAGWQLRVGAFRFDECVTPGFRLTPQPASQSVCVGSPATIGIDISSVNVYDDPVTLMTSGAPGGATEGLLPNPVTPLPGSSELTYTDTGSVSPGLYTIRIDGFAARATSALTTADINFRVLPTSVPELIGPVDAAVDQEVQPTLSWDADSAADEYTVELATDTNFTNIIDSATTTSTSWVPGVVLDATTTYFWRVRTVNACGAGTNSSVRSFTTRNTFCFAGPLNIPDDDATGVNATITIPPGQKFVGAVHMNIKVSHTYVGDLVLTASHGPASAELINQPLNCGGNDIDAAYFDAASGPPNTCSGSGPAIGGNVRPNQAFSVFFGSSYDGTWTLNLSDRTDFDTGALDRWCIDVPTQVFDRIFADGFDLID